MKPDDIVPAQNTGISKDYRFERTYPSHAEALAAFDVAKHKLLNIHNWNNIGGIPGTTLAVTDERGTEINTLAKPGLLVKIDLPGPGTVAGKGADWVCIEDVREEDNPESQWISMRLRPVSSPLSNDQSIAHFFDDRSTSNFVLTRKGNTITIHYAGRNEVANTGTETVTDKIRNAVVATAARFGLSDIQWSTLIKGIIDA